MNNHRTITRQRKQDEEKEYRSKILPRAVTSQAILASVCIICQKKPLSAKKKKKLASLYHHAQVSVQINRS